MRRFKRRIAMRIGRLRWAVLFVALIYLGLRLIDGLLIGPLTLVAEAEARLSGIEAINRVLLGTVGHDLKPEELVAYDRDQTGRIVAYNVNTRLVNAVASEAAEAVKNEFRAFARKPIGVPVGALSGNRLLSSTGPRIPVSLIPVGSVTVDILQDFRAVGINQTRHTIWLKVTATVRVVLPVAAREVQISTDVPVLDTVIVGDVPKVFGSGATGVTVPIEP